ncbi:MAG: alanine/ornithine racemase family PLP-dependent enzyme [Sphaerochaetaceae bacterium]|nr:alanine/ornithine racemase family PLP-dependent enzyme [Sphaerochaetaceae bacterium]MDC7250207.1 alanine/ornithine racemase family PLP-dependent enzyme [Sphaerochaetaceae bacterium]
MEYPKLDINLSTIKNNVQTVVSLCENYGIYITGVTKVFSASKPIVQAFLDGGIRRIGDSRIENLKRAKEFDVEKWLIRVPPISQVKDVLLYSDVSLNSELSTIIKLNEEATKINKIHKVILMVDLGDLREGYLINNLFFDVVKKVQSLSNIQLYGVGTNLTCFSFIKSSNENLTVLDNLAKKLPLKNLVVSGGNSATIKLMLDGQIPPNINNMRLGESLLFGKERSTYTFLKGTRKDAFILSAEVVELKIKPSVPWGEVGPDSYGNIHKKLVDKGNITRAILAIGKQDCDIETMKPIDPNIEIVGASSDYLIVHIKSNDNNYKVGAIIQFELGYYSLMRVMQSEYVSKFYY